MESVEAPVVQSSTISNRSSWVTSHIVKFTAFPLGCQTNRAFYLLGVFFCLATYGRGV
jgi:hypothetical protein